MSNKKKVYTKHQMNDRTPPPKKILFKNFHAKKNLITVISIIVFEND